MTRDSSNDSIQYVISKYLQSGISYFVLDSIVYQNNAYPSTNCGSLLQPLKHKSWSLDDTISSEEIMRSPYANETNYTATTEGSSVYLI